MQDVVGKFREAMYEKEWSNGTERNAIAAAKIDSPIAVAAMKLEQIRVFYLTPNNTIKENIYDQSKGWREGDMSTMEIQTAPYSMIAAEHCSALNGGRLYVQLPDNTIQEYGWNDESSGWKKMSNLGPAGPGTAITCTVFKSPRMSIRVYFQDSLRNLKEKCFDEGKGWYDGAFKVSGSSSKFVPFRAAMACTSHHMGSDRVGINVFFVTAKGIQEMVYDGKWREGKLDVECIPGSEVAVTSWGSGKDMQMRLYFQKGEHVSGITEWVWKQEKWESGKMALPPA
ncbi:Fungal fucose-specific lectin [Penicillium lividum]|nr:Fungal fucose-specific lectin [Penicillium lividum]